jgi:thioredoxin-related protein
MTISKINIKEYNPHKIFRTGKQKIVPKSSKIINSLLGRAQPSFLLKDEKNHTIKVTRS